MSHKEQIGELQAWLDGPLEDGEDLLILLHGRGTDGGDLVDLGPAFAWPGRVVGFDAPEPWTEAGVGRIWFRNETLREGIEASSTALLRSLDALAERCPNSAKPVLAGFSQGGVMTYECGLANPGRFRALVVMSGWLPESSPLRQHPPRPEEMPPLLVTHGAVDPMVDVNRARESQAFLQSVGLSLRYVEDMTAHTISPAQARAVADFLGEVVG